MNKCLKGLFNYCPRFANINNPSRCIQPGAVFKPAENYSTGRKQSIYSDEWCKKGNSREIALDVTTPALTEASCLADVLLGVASDGPANVLTARRLADRVVVDFESDRNVAVVGELVARGQTNLTTSLDSAAINLDVVAVLNENGIVAVIGQVERLDFSGTRLGNAEKATATTTGDDLVDENVCLVLAVGALAVVVGEAESAVSGTCTDVATVDETDLGVGGLLDEKATLADVAGDNLVDLETIDVPGLNSVAAGTGDADSAHLDVRVGGLVSVESDTQASAKVHRDISEHQVLGTVESEAKVRRASHGEVRNLNICSVEGLDSAVSSSVGNVNGTTSLKDLAAVDADGARTNGTRRNNRDALAAADGVDGSLDRGKIVGARVDLSRPAGSCERAVGARHLGVGCTSTTLGLDASDEGEGSGWDQGSDHGCDYLGRCGDKGMGHSPAPPKMEEQRQAIYIV